MKLRLDTEDIGSTIQIKFKVRQLGIAEKTDAEAGCE